MELNNPVMLTSSLAKVLHCFCNGFVEFETFVHLTGDLGLITGDGRSVRFSVDEKVHKLHDSCIKISSDSFHYIITSNEEDDLEAQCFSSQAHINSNNKADTFTHASTDSILAGTQLPEIDSVLDNGKSNINGHSMQQIYESESQQILQTTGIRSLNNEVDQPFQFDVKQEVIDIKFEIFKSFDECSVASEIQDSNHNLSHEKINDQGDSGEVKRADEGEKEESDREVRSDEQELEQEEDADKLENTLPEEEADKSSVPNKNKKENGAKKSSEVKKQNAKVSGKENISHGTSDSAIIANKRDSGKFESLKEEPSTRVRQSGRVSVPSIRFKEFMELENPFRKRQLNCEDQSTVSDNEKKKILSKTPSGVKKQDDGNKTSDSAVIENLSIDEKSKQTPNEESTTPVRHTVKPLGEIREVQVKEELSCEESISCPSCFKVFNNPMFLQTHLWQIHNYSKSYAYNFVNKMCVSPLKNNTNEKNMESSQNLTCKSLSDTQCKICGKLFISKSRLKRHQVVHSGEKNYSCEICGRRFVNKYGLVRHCNNLHFGMKKVDSQKSLHNKFPTGIKKVEPSKIFSNTLHSGMKKVESSKNFHNNIHSGMKKVQSSKNFHNNIHSGMKQVQSSKNFRLIIKTASGTKCKCEVCGKTFSSKSQLNQHYVVHKGEKNFACETCGKKFSQKYNIERHHSRVHCGIKPYRCIHCGKSFAHKWNLDKHQLTHTKISPPHEPFRKKISKKNISHKSELKHPKKTHPDKKLRPFKCPFCHAAFANSSDLTKHKRIHTGEKPYKCDICFAAFSDSSQRSRHRRRHTGVRPYKCDMCTSAYVCSQDLLRHCASCHPGETPFKCPNCPDMEFCSSYHLKRHQKTSHLQKNND